LLNVSSKIKPFTFIVYDTVFSDSGAFFVIISDVIKKIHQCGIRIFTIVCDGLPSQVSVLDSNNPNSIQFKSTDIVLKSLIMVPCSAHRINNAY